ncbi:MAG TPA: F0F1 ATP synthase subunit A [Thermomicrobiales bacterium]|nr:F0F1 ATP synthase subunit A [Thermomicrobiales bacterium]
MEIHVELAAEELFKIGPIPVTNSMLTMFIVMALILIIFSSIARKAQMVPGRGQGFLESIAEFLLGLVEGTAGKRAGRRIFPLIAGLFVFILFANYSGLFPGVGVIGFYEDEETADEHQSEPADETEGANVVAYEIASTGSSAAAVAAAPQEGEEEEHERVLVPFLRSPNADLNMTLAMALVTFTVVQIAGIRAHGVGGRIKHMADPWWIFPLELVQEFARIISLSFRLFGNVFAGEILLAVMYAIANAVKIAVIPILFPVVFLGLELLFGTIQALVFALLTLIYITLATAGGHADEEHEHDRGHEPAARDAHAAPAGAGD